MTCAVRIGRLHEMTLAHTVESLRQVLGQPDGRGGGEFWIEHVESAFPCLAIRTSTGRADVHYFPRKDHPGFRLLSRNPKQEEVRFQYEECDPSEGELVPGEFVVTLPEALRVAAHFMQCGGMLESLQWYEL